MKVKLSCMVFERGGDLDQHLDQVKKINCGKNTPPMLSSHETKSPRALLFPDKAHTYIACSIVDYKHLR